MKRIIFAIIFLAVIIGVAAGTYLYFKPHPDLRSQSSDFNLASTDLLAAFVEDEAAANGTYLNAVIEVKGPVREMTPIPEGGMTLILGGQEDMFGVNCAFLADDADPLVKIEQGDIITVKGICTGMLMDVNLSRCVLLER